MRFGPLVVVLGLAACDQGADLIVANGRVYTMSWAEPDANGAPAADAPFENGQWHPDAEAVVVDDGHIVFVGTTAEAEAYRGRRTRYVDVDGATVLPGLVDAHVHVAELGTNLLQPRECPG